MPDGWRSSKVAIALLSVPVPEPGGGEVGAGLVEWWFLLEGRRGREGRRGPPGSSPGNVGSHSLGSSKSWLGDAGLSCPYPSD